MQSTYLKKKKEHKYQKESTAYIEQHLSFIQFLALGDPRLPASHCGNSSLNDRRLRPFHLANTGPYIYHF